MPKVDFYILSNPSPQAPAQFTCRLIEKAYLRGHTIYLHTASKALANEMDALLWTFRDDSFVPHALVDATPAKPSPIMIGYATPPGEPTDLLISANPAIPPGYDRYQRLIEIVGPDTAAREIAREHYRFYKAQGCPLQSHAIKH